jgi:hypothetical protein
MNERIKELAEQAGFCMWKEEKWNPGDVIDWSCRYDDELEKFFDLIVRECAALAKSKSEYIQSMETDDRGDQMQIQSLAWQFEEFGYKIKKHFGVEE